MAFDNTGGLFVAIAISGSIIEITPGGALSTFVSGMRLLSRHEPMAFDSAGNLFLEGIVEDSLGFLPFGGITEITPNGVQSTFASGLNGPDGLAFNSAGDLFASCGSSSDLSTSGKIFELAPNGAQSTFASGLTDPFCLAFNNA